jgi:uncharacterized membrane protein YphA (DoxX/SURF4 family)
MEKRVPRPLQWVDSRSPALSNDELDWAKRGLLLTVAAEGLGYFLVGLFSFRAASPDGFWAFVSSMSVVLLVLLGFSFVRRARRAQDLLTVAAFAAVFIGSFPQAANHIFVATMAATALLLHRERAVERRAVALAWRWILLVIVFAAGWQKLRHGEYDHGEYLTYAALSDSRMGLLDSLIVPASQVEHLRLALAPGMDIPVHPPVFPGQVLSWLVLFGELLLPLLVLWSPRFRTASLWAIAAILVGAQLYAREFGFALLVVWLLISFAPGRYYKTFFLCSLFVWPVILGLTFVGRVL